ncbi:hypothetical protein [Bifidobacterium animalis]|uniref:hypothetical protein n=1 Tax=Bifidobacterium animalis TaxID=28025 RepID=UPI001C3EA0B6|nr:hypothetical protein [Bifidobacterium animalis]
MRVLQETLVVFTWIVMMIGVWKCLQDKAPSWWLLTLVIASILFMFFYRTKYLLPISCKAYEIIMGVLAVILWALLMILLLSVVGILPVTFTFR